MDTERRREGGFSLLEVLAAIVILSVVALAMTSLFVHAMAYSKGNQNKTIEVNLARNALFFLGKQDFDQFDKYFENSDNGPISPTSCETEYSCSNSDLTKLIEDIPELWGVLNPIVNGREYSVEVSLAEVVKDGMDTKLEAYLLPVRVTVYNEESSKSSGRNSAIVEGYITNEKIR